MTRLLQALKNKQVLAAFLVPVPILGYWVYWTLNPSYWFNADPAALYFIDSLSIFVGGSYVYVDHPGTPVQVLGSMLLALVYPFFGNTENFVQFFLTRPNVFFFIANVFLLIVNIFCALVFYRTVVRDLQHNKILAAIAIALLFFALHPHSYPSLTFWSHNSFNFPFGTLLLLWLYNELRNSVNIGRGKLILLGAGSGILSIAQVYFFAWLAGVIFTLGVYDWYRTRDIKRAAVTGLYVSLGGLIGIILMFIPIYRELPRFFVWLFGLITHLGLYGSGESGIYSPALLTTSIAYWWNTVRPMVLLIVCTWVALGIFMYWTRKTSAGIAAGDFAMVTGLLFHMLLVMFLLTKAALKLRYSLSLAAVLPVFVFMVIKLLEAPPWKTHRLLIPFYGLVIIGVVTSLITEVRLADRRAYQEQDAQVAKVQAINRLAKEKDVPEEEIVVVYAFGVPMKCAGLLQATNWTGHFQQELSKMCPNQFAIWDSTIELNTAVPVRDIEDIDWDVVIWPGNGTNLPEYLYSKGAITIPDSWRVRRNKWFFIHPIEK